MVFMSITMLYRRRPLRTLITYQVLLTVFVFLFYLPAFCFSGTAAFTENKYMKLADSGLSGFIPSFFTYFRTVINYCFSGTNSVVNIILFLLPLELFVTPKKEHRTMALCYLILWGVFIAMSICMERVTFYRVIIMQMSLTMAFVVYTCYILISGVVTKFNMPRVGIIVFAIPVLFLCGHLMKHDKNDVALNLYFNNVNELYSKHIADINTIPKGSSVAFSDESFYYYYYCRELGYKVSKCPNGTEDYYVSRPEEETIPSWVADNYTLFRKCDEDYDIYKRK
jgi:hypothetical protein